MALDPIIRQELSNVYQRLNDNGKLYSVAQLNGFYNAFRQRFGPERLQNLDGEALLETMHAPGTDSMIYWLEFKSDQEFPGNFFGSIAGGSALKFGIYRRRETGTWMAGSPQRQQELSTAQAVEIARRHRDQFIEGAKILDQLPEDASDEDYQELQRLLWQDAPDVSDTSWGHKYFCLLFPTKLEDMHNREFQRFHLIRLLQTPPEGEGRYICAGRYVAIAREFSLMPHVMTSVMGERNWRPYDYWRIGTGDGKGGRDYWEMMREGNFVAIGWDELGDLSSYQYDEPSKQAIKKRIGELYYSNSPSTAGRKGVEVFRFVTGLSGLVLACDGATVLGVGKVTGPYYYEPDPSSHYRHRRPVEWLNRDEWKLNPFEGQLTTVFQIHSASNKIEAERRILGAKPPGGGQPGGDGTSLLLEGIPARIQTIVERKGQVILYGPPGTGKTYWAELAARELAARTNFHCAYDQLSPEQQDLITGNNGYVRLCSFHPAYGYEDFLEGYRPELVNDAVAFRLRDGIFKRLCKDAEQALDRRFYLIIDEINRGDIPRIFGELLTLLERDKRGKRAVLPLSGDDFQIPANVFVIGTMNTADRSIALIDTALRRRFGFVELMPDYAILGNAQVSGIPLALWLEALNKRICSHLKRDARNLQIGHAYLLDGRTPVADFTRFARIIREDVIPLLEEYCYEDYATLEHILGNVLVDVQNQSIRQDLFDEARQDELVQALLAPSPDLLTSAQAIATEAATSEIDEDRDAEGNESDV